MREPGHDVRYSARGMTPRQSRIDLQISKSKIFSLVDWLRARHWFARRRKNICAGFFSETRQIRDVIGVRMRQQNQLQSSLWCFAERTISLESAPVSKAAATLFAGSHTR